MDRITKEQRSYNMSRIKSRNTKPEKFLFRELKNSRYKFRRHSSLPGKPDAVMVQYKIAIFVDGEFWHGKNFKDWKNRITPFWKKKIGDNIRRDRKNNNLLKKQGWIVIHIWGRDIIKNSEKTLSRIRKVTEEANLR